MPGPRNTGGRKPRPWGICQRSGMRYYLDELVRDGRNPDMLVHPKNWEPKEKKGIYRPRRDEFRLRDPSPDTSVEVMYLKMPTEDADTGEGLTGFTIAVVPGEMMLMLPAYVIAEDGTPIITEDGLHYVIYENAERVLLVPAWLVSEDGKPLIAEDEEHFIGVDT